MSFKTKSPLIKMVFSLTIGILFGAQAYGSAPHLSTFSSSVIMPPIFLPLILRQIPYRLYLPIVWRT